MILLTINGPSRLGLLIFAAGLISVGICVAVIGPRVRRPRPGAPLVLLGLLFIMIGSAILSPLEFKGLVLGVGLVVLSLQTIATGVWAHLKGVPTGYTWRGSGERISGVALICSSTFMLTFGLIILAIHFEWLQEGHIWPFYVLLACWFVALFGESIAARLTRR